MTDARISVLVPTWRRPEVLLRCVRGLQSQSLRPAQVVVTVRGDDDDTRRALSQFDAGPLTLLPVPVDAGPVTTAMGIGLRRTSGAIVAITDDDAEPRPDWLERMAAHFTDPAVGGVGGRDFQVGEDQCSTHVGEVGWFGRVVGNHHVGSGAVRDVQLLKGVNCAFRGDPLREIGFDSRMRGVGTVIHWELALSFAFLKRGWRLVYDPAAAVDHHVAPRHDIDQRRAFNAEAHRNIVHNETLSLLDYLSPPRRVAFLAWALAVGTGESPGLVQLPRLLVEGRPRIPARWWATLSGRTAGTASHWGLNGRP